MTFRAAIDASDKGPVMTRTVVQIRLSPEEKKAWEVASGGNISQWLRRLANEDVALGVAEQLELDIKKAEREQLVKTTFPQGNKCIHVEPGQWCYHCNRKRWE
jgi:hypothetical protein